MRRIHRNALDRAHLHALRLIEVAHALGALGGIDLVDLRSERNRLVGALRLADIAVDALVGDQKGHAASPAASGSVGTGLDALFQTVEHQG